MESIFGGGEQKAPPRAQPKPTTTAPARHESSIVSQQPMGSIKSTDQSNERINPADSTSVKISDVTIENHEGKIEDMKPDIEEVKSDSVEHLHP